MDQIFFCFRGVALAIADKDTYLTDPEKPRPLFFTACVHFYPQAFWMSGKNGRRALKGCYDGNDWANSSLDILQALENIGVRFEITGMDNMRKFQGLLFYSQSHEHSGDLCTALHYSACKRNHFYRKTEPGNHACFWPCYAFKRSCSCH